MNPTHWPSLPHHRHARMHPSAHRRLGPPEARADLARLEGDRARWARLLRAFALGVLLGGLLGAWFMHRG